MTLTEVLHHFRYPSALCRAIGVSRQTVSAWQKRGYISFFGQLKIETATDGKFKAVDYRRSIVPNKHVPAGTKDKDYDKYVNIC